MDTVVKEEDGRRRGKTGKEEGGRKEGRARGGSRKGSESGKIKAKSESEGRERGREKEGKLDGVEKRGLGRCFSVPSSPCFHSPPFSPCFSFFSPPPLFKIRRYRGIFRVLEKKKEKKETKVVGTNVRENLANEIISFSLKYQFPISIDQQTIYKIFRTIDALSFSRFYFWWKRAAVRRTPLLAG